MSESRRGRDAHCLNVGGGVLQFSGHSGRLWVHAPAVHTGGGLVLLKALLASPALPATIAYVDERAFVELRDAPTARRVALRPVSPRSLTRLYAQWQIAGQAAPGDIILCLQGVPLPFRVRARQIVFLQNRHLLEAGWLWSLPPKAALQTALGKLLIRLFAGHAEIWMVQTPSMRRALLSRLRLADADVRVVPYSGNEGLSPIVEPMECPAARCKIAQGRVWDFLYVADGLAHKNHRRLIDAWRLLAAQGVRPTLALTLGPRDARLVAWVSEQAAQYDLPVVNLGSMSHRELLQIYRQAGALIYPSLSESLGLPLVEAAHLGVPIVAAESDYVRDVCVPVESFDPMSPHSIARAVRRALGEAEAPVRIRPVEDFVHELMR